MEGDLQAVVEAAWEERAQLGFDTTQGEGRDAVQPATARRTSTFAGALTCAPCSRTLAFKCSTAGFIGRGAAAFDETLWNKLQWTTSEKATKTTPTTRTRR